MEPSVGQGQAVQAVCVLLPILPFLADVHLEVVIDLQENLAVGRFTGVMTYVRSHGTIAIKKES